MKIDDGLIYEQFRYHDSECFLLTVDLEKHAIRPVIAAEQFPFQGQQPARRAVEQGALACVDGGYNIVLGHDLGVTDQPQHALVVNKEIWTTGIGGGGYGVLLGDQHLTTRKNLLSVRIWRPDRSSFQIDSINLYHSKKVAAFTARGGTNDVPVQGKHYARLRPLEDLVDMDGGHSRKMVVDAIARDDPLFVVKPDDVALEGRWSLRLAAGDEVSWVQRLGGTGVHTIVSGWPELIHEGKMADFDTLLHPESSEGPDNWFTRINPRSAIGASRDGKTAYFFVVQGRTDYSDGLRCKEMAQELHRRKVWYAVNMDGGGSVFLWLKAKGLVAPGCYNYEKDMEHGRPAQFSVAVW